MLCHWWHLNICHICIYSNFSKTWKPPFFLSLSCRPWSRHWISYKRRGEGVGGGGGGGPRFRDNDALSWHQKNLFSTLWHLDKNFMCDIVDVIGLERFRIVTHSNTASFLRKVTLCETNNIFYSQEYQVWHKDDNRFWKVIENKGEVTVDGFRNFPYVSSYLRLKTFAWKRDYIISQKLQMPQTSPRPFQKACIEFY